MRAYLLFIILLVCCTPKKDNYELNYSEEKLKAVLIDVYVISEILDDVSAKEKDSLRMTYIRELERIHEVDFSIVERDLEWLQLNPEKYKEIHSAAKDSISVIEKRMKARKRK